MRRRCVLIYVPRFPVASGRRRSAAVGAALAIAVIGALTPSLASAATAGWTVSSSPNVADPANSSRLNAAACPTVSDCWAVGRYYSTPLRTFQTLIEHNAGSGWNVVSSPNSTTGWDELHSVACNSVTDCWAVGEAADGSSGVDSSLIEHYDGAKWSLVSAPSPPGPTTEANLLQGVTCVSSADCWAVGFYNNSVGLQQPLFEHYDGNGWSVVSSPSVTGLAHLFGVSCSSTSDCWAAGAYADFCNGVPDMQFCFHTLTEHYDGSSWKIVPSPSPDLNSANQFSGDLLTGVSCASSSYCFAVGYSYPPITDRAVILQNTGSGWSVASNTEGNLNGVSCTTTKFCVAVGSSVSQDQGNTLIEESTGGAWTMVTSPNGATGYNTLNGISCTSACFAVGYTNPNNNQNSELTLIEQRLDPTTTTVSCSPSSLSVGNATTCTATVQDTDTSPSTPTGTVSFSSDSSGSFGGSGSCTLAGSGASASCQLTYTPSAAGTHTITARYGGDAVHAPSSGTTTLTASAAADLSITNSDSPDPVPAGDLLTYTVTVTNNGPSTAHGITMTDSLPRSIRVRSARPDTGGCMLRRVGHTTIITCRLGDLAAGESATVTIVGQPTRKGTFTSTASVSATDPVDPDLSNNTATQTTTVKG